MAAKVNTSVSGDEVIIIPLFQPAPIVILHDRRSGTYRLA